MHPLFSWTSAPQLRPVAVLLMCAVLGVDRRASAQAVSPAMSLEEPVVVLAFEPRPGTQGDGWLREGAALLLSDLFEAHGIEVVRREERIAAFERLQLPPHVPVSRASALRVGNVLGAGTVVVGQFARHGNSVELRARAMTLSPPSLSSEVSETRLASSLFDAVSSLAGTLTRRTGPSVAWSPPPSVSAFAAMVEGLVAERLDEQERFLQASLKLAPSYADARLALGALLRESGRYRAALAAVSAVPQTAPESRRSRFLTALCLIDLTRYDEAFRVLRDLLKLQPAAEVSNALGVVQMRRAPTPQTDEPAYYFTQAVELAPEEADLYFNLGYAYWRARDAQGSAYWMREAVRRNPADAEAHWILGTALLQLGATVEGQRERALARQLSGDEERWRAAAETSGVPPGLERLPTRLDATRRRGQPLDAPSSATERTSLARFHLDAGRRAFERGDDRDAIAALRRATFLSPYLAEAHVLLGRLYLRADRIDEAVVALRIALWSEDEAETRHLLTEALARQRPVP